jgi:hypothetical protein
MTRSVLQPQIKESELSLRKLTIDSHRRIPQTRVFRLNRGKKYRETRYTKGSIAVQAFPDVIVDLREVF